MHSMGNSTGGAEVLEIILSGNVVQGGFVWDWMDWDVNRSSTVQKKYWSRAVKKLAYGGYYENQPEFITITIFV